MEQAKLWMWTRRKQPNNVHQPLFDSPSTPMALRLPMAPMPSSMIESQSWEEMAFARDSSDLLGGCIWPPRSYSCSFCGREFRSAQALGGHMNVHRRDRARLKQSSIVEEEEEEEGGDGGVMVLHDTDTFPSLNPHFNPNPNPNYGYEAASNCEEALRLMKRGLDDDDEQELKKGSKMKRVDSILCTPFFVMQSLTEQNMQEPEMISMINPEFAEELDLELRLGDSPKVK